jgi:hypothetical protein
MVLEVLEKLKGLRVADMQRWEAVGQQACYEWPELPADTAVLWRRNQLPVHLFAGCLHHTSFYEPSRKYT